MDPIVMPDGRAVTWSWAWTGRWMMCDEYPEINSRHHAPTAVPRSACISPSRMSTPW